MRRIFFAIICVVAFVVPAHAQSLGPVIAEYNLKQGKTAKGSFKIQNEQSFPIAVVIEANTVKFDTLGPHYVPLDSACQVEFPQSFRISPREIYEVPYRVTCSQSSAQVVLLAKMITGRTAQGIQIRIILPHMVYIGESKHPRYDVLKPLGLCK